LTEETSVTSSSKKYLFDRNSFLTGALARLRNSGDILKGTAKSLFNELDLKVFYSTPLNNSLAQLIEIIYSLELSSKIIFILLSENFKEEKLPEISLTGGSGTACTEVPRGLLYHSYIFDKEGSVAKAEIITPTAQNIASIEQNIKASLPSQFKDKKEYTAFIEKMIRSFDPCISCSVH